MGRGEWAALGKSWWCRGGGAAVVMLLAVVSVFRAPRDAIFWIAVAFFIAHTALTVRRYLIERRNRTTATVLRHHHATDAPAGMVFRPVPVNSLVPLKIPPKLHK
jgi:hypothetical protein